MRVNFYMRYKCSYKTPREFSNIIITSDGEYLIGLFFENSKDDTTKWANFEEKDLPVFKETIKWLDTYFDGKIPEFTPKYRIENLTSFRREVIEILNSIPYGKTLTYNDIANTIAKKRGISKMSAQAVGGAVGKNPICIIVPCHRVIGKNSNLTGYGGGMKNKIALLKLEKIISKCEEKTVCGVVKYYGR